MIKRVLIIAGGTGGHVFPALAIAQALQKQEIEVVWLGTKKGMEVPIVKAHNIPIDEISIKGLRGKRFTRLLFAPFILCRALIQSLRIIKRSNADVVLGMGGFASGPGGLAAWLLKKPLVIHEQNAVLGLTNRILSRFAKLKLAGFPIKNFQYVGNPIRPELEYIPEPEIRFENRKGPVNLLIIGGSQGSAAFNRVIPKAMFLLSKKTSFNVWHQGGKKYCNDALRGYEAVKIAAKVEPFVSNMEEAYEWADIIISRSGASTVSEISTIGLASILVPYPYAVDDHQTKNAKFLVDNKAAILLPHEQFSPENLANILEPLCENRKQLETMAEAARELRKADATDVVVKELYSV